MPLYEYLCGKCKKRFERIEKVDAKTVKKCPHCGGRAERTLAPSAIQFKGSGWYVTDYAGKSGASSEKSESKPAAEASKESTAAKEPKKTSKHK